MKTYVILGVETNEGAVEILKETTTESAAKEWIAREFPSHTTVNRFRNKLKYVRFPNDKVRYDVILAESEIDLGWLEAR